MKILIVEDNDSRIGLFKENLKNQELVIFKSSKGAIEYLQKNKVDLIFLDHDLGFDPRTKEKTDSVFLPSGEGTGYEVAEYLSDNFLDIPVFVHSWNPLGSKNICDKLTTAKWVTFGMPGFTEIIRLISDGYSIKVCPECVGIGYKDGQIRCSKCNGIGFLITKNDVPESGQEK